MPVIFLAWPATDFFAAGFFAAGFFTGDFLAVSLGVAVARALFFGADRFAFRGIGGTY